MCESLHGHILHVYVSIWTSLTSALLSPTPLVRSMIVVVTFPSFITLVDISNCQLTFACVKLKTLTSVFVKFRVTFYSNFVFVSRFLVIRGWGSGRGWCCPDPPHLSASLPDWGWPSASAASAQVRVMVHSSLFIAVLVTVRWWPVCLESSYCPRVRHQSRGRSSHTTQVNLGCLRSGQAQAWRGKLTGSKRNCQHLRILFYYCLNDITIQLES